MIGRWVVMRRLVVLAVLLGGVLTVDARPVVAQGTRAAAKACQHGGYATKVRGTGPDKGKGFATVGECVSYVAQGGTLAPRTLGASPCDLVRSYDPSTHQPSLAGLDLSACDLSGAALPGADLVKAYLVGGYLPGADLRGANLRGAVLNFANLNSANLTAANLTGASMVAANLAYANLTGADLSGAILDRAIWANTTCPDGTNSEANGGTCLGHL